MGWKISCSILNLTETKLIDDLETFGFLFESLVERDLKIYADANNYNTFHYQDYKKNKVDHIIELEDGSWCAFEIKLGTNKIDEAAIKLKNLANSCDKKPKILCVVCGLTNYAYIRSDGVYVIPITALKN